MKGSILSGTLPGLTDLSVKRFCPTTGMLPAIPNPTAFMADVLTK
jgi:hypothetical protein